MTPNDDQQKDSPIGNAVWRDVKLIDDPIRIVALSDRREVESSLCLPLPGAPWPVRRSVKLIYGTAIRNRDNR